MARREQSSYRHVPTTTRLGTGTVLNGTLRFGSSVRVEGRFLGKIESEGLLIIEERADVRADVRAGTVLIAGTVHGDIHATERVEVLPSGRIHGNIRTTRLRISDGVVFEGRCEMIRNSEAVDIFSAPVQELKETLPRPQP